MSETATQRELFTDSSALFRALLPEAAGFLFHDRKMRYYWRDETSDNFAPSPEYNIALLETLKHGEILGEHDRVAIDEYSAIIFPMRSESGWNLGAVTVLVSGELATKPKEWIGNLIAPALQSLQRELGLRYRLVRTHRRMEEKSSDHKFLRMLGEWSRADVTCEEALESILNCCSEHFGTGSVSLMVPDKRIEVHTGEPAIDKPEAIMLIAEQNVNSAGNTQPDPRQFNKNGSRIYHCNINQDKRYPVGLLCIPGSNDEDFAERLNNIAEAVATSIEYVIERDFDSLTGLPRHEVLEGKLSEACEHDDGNYTVMHFDIDRMQLVNDSFGREFGDEIVRTFANILRSAMSAHSVARLSGSNFAALLYNASTAQAEELAQQICSDLRQNEYTIEGKEFTPTVSIGVAPLIVTDEGARAALSPAIVACDAAKDRGRGRVETYQPTDASIVKRLDDIQIIGSVRSALNNDRLELHAQPLSPLNGEHPHPCFEVLARMQDENGKAMEPAQFISAAERFQVMPELDQWVVDKTIGVLEDQKREHGREPHVAINLSGQSLCNETFIKFLRERLSSLQIDRSQICFEITETVAVTNLDQAQDFVKEFKSMGCKFSLDDFGTGLSSFTYLKLFPVDTLKIDGSFISDIETNEISRSMVTAISEIAKVMELDTVAEYVQNKASADILHEMGIGWVQGHYVGKPKPLQDYLNGANGATARSHKTDDSAPTTSNRTLPDDFLPEYAIRNMRLQDA